MINTSNKMHSWSKINIKKLHTLFTTGPKGGTGGGHRVDTLSETKKEENVKMKRRKRKMKERRKKGEKIGIKFEYWNTLFGNFYFNPVL